MEIVTGRTGTPHVTSADHRGIISMISGGVSAIANAYENLAVELAANNVLKIKSGFLLHRGCVGRVKRGTYDEVPFSPGIVGMKRKDLVVARYEHFNDDTEKLDWYVIEGTPAETNPAVPAYEDGNLQFGDSVDDCPFAVITLDGLNASVETLIADYDKLKLRETFLSMHPVGSIIFSESSKNPGEIYGGTWVSWGAGRVPIGVGVGNDGKTSKNILSASMTGGEYEHTLTNNEAPSHKHSMNNHYFHQSSNVAMESEMGANFVFEPLNTSNVEFNYTDTSGGNQPHNNMQPWISCYMWKRTA